ncbi:MAG TPA: hypothetical protein VNO30_02750 [Kofleriaceae bacterium]|nr:hypothetical protein [Kofleriaceae bacterium]
MNTTHRSLLFSLALSACATACATSSSDDAPDIASNIDGVSPGALPAQLAPWGGADAARWTPEAILANAVTPELQRDPTTRVSVPVALWKSTYAPYGDGQTNAAAAFVSWSGARPPVVGTKRGTRIEIRFDRTLPFSGDTFELWTPSGAWVQSVPSTRTAAGDWLVSIASPPAAVAERLVVSPRGWRDGFPLSFALPVTTVSSLASSLPQSLRRLPGGEPVVDPVAAALAAGSTRTVYDVLRSSSFPAGFINQSPFVSSSLHASFPQGGAPRVTAVGGSSTWVAESPFKDMYVCLDRRGTAAEATYGVPSGAGWHNIGDAGESILASLETSPFLIGYAAGAPLAPPAGGALAYGLSHATTFALLQPGQAFTSPRGDFHWYAVHHATSPCVQVWVHRCVPSASAPSMACPGD